MDLQVAPFVVEPHCRTVDNLLQPGMAKKTLMEKQQLFGIAESPSSESYQSPWPMATAISMAHPGKKPFSGNTAHLRPNGLADEDLAQPVTEFQGLAMQRDAAASRPREVAF